MSETSTPKTFHTQGEWVQNGENGIHTKQGHCIALTYGENGLNKKANAQRIVKAVNMHDELVKTLEQLESIYSNKKEVKGLSAFEVGILVTIQGVVRK